MYNEGLSNLIKAMGGGQAVVNRVNTLRDRFKTQVPRPLSLHAIYDWTNRAFPMGWRQWVLAAALDMGISSETAVELCPDLRPAVSVALFIAERLDREKAA